MLSSRERPVADEPRLAPVLPDGDAANQYPKQDYMDLLQQARRGRAGLLHSLAAWHPAYKCQTISTTGGPRRRQGISNSYLQTDFRMMFPEGTPESDIKCGIWNVR